MLVTIGTTLWVDLVQAVYVGIVLSLLFEAIRFFQLVPPSEFLFGLEWSPQTALREDQVGQSGSFGAVPMNSVTHVGAP